MTVGLVVSIVQAATQIQEMTLVFVPKMLAVFAGVVLFAAFMLDVIARFTLMIFDLVARGGTL
jgi:flagellar biosynthetic protein FliQ